MTDKQPESLRLADELDRPYWDDGTPHGQHVKAAALLRTQHADIERKDALLRQALEVLRKAWPGDERAAEAAYLDCIDAIKQELSQ